MTYPRCYTAANGHLMIEVPEGWTPPQPASRKKYRSKSGVSKRRRALIFERDGYQCLKCGSRENLSIDHIIPVSRGGNHYESNLQTLCFSCNARKGARHE